MMLPDWHTPWLLLIALQPMAIILLRLFFEKNSLNQYARAELQPWVRAHHNTQGINYSLLRNIGYWLAWILFAVAAAGPRVAEEVASPLSNNGKDIMLVLDISQSMQATDIKPSRLRQAHEKIDFIINELPNSRIGLIVYAAKPHIYIPITHDMDAINFYLANLDFLTPPSQGTRPSFAIKLAHEELTRVNFPNKQRSKYILHITDTDTDEKETSAINDTASVLLDKKIPLYTLMMASDKGEAVPSFKDGWLSTDGRPVVSRPNASTHQQFSLQTGGEFAHSFNNHSGVQSLIEAIKENQHSSTTGVSTDKINWHEQFPLFLLIGILCLMFSMSPYKLSINTPHKLSSLLVIFILLNTLTVTDVSARQSDTQHKAYQALINKDYLKARKLYAAMNDFTGSYGEAVATYQLGDYPRAIRLFEQALLIAKSNSDYTNTLYNLGNSYFQIGNFQSAITSYKGALLYGPTHQPSQHNLVYVKRALLAVEKRTKTLEITSRAGRGPRSARAVENLVINENTGVSLDESESLTQNTQNNATNSELDIPEFIILKGLGFAQKSRPQDGQNSAASEEFVPSIAINTQLNKLYDDQSRLWRRIFEIEEGYPAPLEEPEKIPGVLPW